MFDVISVLLPVESDEFDGEENGEKREEKIPAERKPKPVEGDQHVIAGDLGGESEGLRQGRAGDELESIHSLFENSFENLSNNGRVSRAVIIPYCCFNQKPVIAQLNVTIILIFLTVVKLENRLHTGSHGPM